ncbi:DUF952 domain-containing protein [Candidatus Pelagibacter bacterium nBUS_30]|uniref:DUF952 domain-containing protein n=1 Tax=Candidatus Pelagibacter bacterium nBUS_30 TaxID=3374191 RepID=UPI003EBBC524
MNLKYIFKIIDKEEWQKVKESGTYLGSAKDIQDGFIHFSGEEQVKGTLEKYYLKQKNLVLLKVETLKLDHLIWEQASDGNMFPHLYSSLDLSNVVDEFEIILSDDGTHKLPDNFN